jgi:hypothetical protein
VQVEKLREHRLRTFLLGLVGITEELSNGEFAAFDPEARGLADESNE